MGTPPLGMLSRARGLWTEKDLDWTPPLPLSCSIPMAMYSRFGYAP